MTTFPLCTTILVLLVSAGAAWMHFNVPSAAACSCAALTPSQAFERADTVFVGEVTSFKTKSGLFGQSSIDPTTVNFTVMEVWKGPRQGTLTIGTVRSQVSCGYEFQEGLRYLVYARDGQTGLCDRTALAVQASEDLAALGEGWKPDSPNPAGTVPTVEPHRDTSSAPGGNGCGATPDSRYGAAEATLAGLLVGAIALSIRRRPRL